MKISLTLFGALALLTPAIAQNKDVPKILPGELTAEQILNGQYAFPPSPQVESHDDWSGFAKERLTKVPVPGVHPRVLLSPEDLPDLRKRLAETDAGRLMFANLRMRVQKALHGTDWGHDLYERLMAEDDAGATKLLADHKGLPPGIGHYQAYFDAIVMDAFDAMVSDDQDHGKRVAAAIATYALVVEPLVDSANKQPLSDNVWRQEVGTEVPWGAGTGGRDAVDGQMLGYGYDFAYNFMTEAQRDATRRVISKATYGKIWMGANLPHHWRNWNWIAIGLQEPLLALAIEGESGYDPRVYKLGAQIARDYLTYAISPSGASTEAVGYTQFGLVWGNPFFVAAARRGDNLLVNSHHRAMIDWYLQNMEPHGAQWTSHGDGGDGGPSLETLSMWHYYYPNDAKIDFVLQNVLTSLGPSPYTGRYHNIEPLIWASDGIKDIDGKPIDYASGAKLALPLLWFDPIRSSLDTRSAWTPDAASFEFECRTDSVGPSHEHADRGNFTLSALGRQWAKESFRSIETRHHNSVLVDGMGQGYWPGPGRWLGMQDANWAVIAACDAKDAYDWWWPKVLGTDDPKTEARLQFHHWNGYVAQATQFRKDYGNGPFRETHVPRRPSISKSIKRRIHGCGTKITGQFGCRIIPSKSLSYRGLCARRESLCCHSRRHSERHAGTAL